MRARGYGALDLAFAALYAYLGFVVAPSRSRAFSLALTAVIVLLGGAGLALLLRGDRGQLGRRLGIAACSVLLGFTIVCVLLLVASCSFLFGVYGAIGHGIGLIALVVAALLLELCGLLPLFQLRFHLATRRDPTR